MKVKYATISLYMIACIFCLHIGRMAFLKKEKNDNGRQFPFILYMPT